MQDRRNVHLEDRQARSRQGPLGRHRHLHRKEDGRLVTIHPQHGRSKRLPSRVPAGKSIKCGTWDTGQQADDISSLTSPTMVSSPSCPTMVPPRTTLRFQMVRPVTRSTSSSERRRRTLVSPSCWDYSLQNTDCFFRRHCSYCYG